MYAVKKTDLGLIGTAIAATALAAVLTGCGGPSDAVATPAKATVPTSCTRAISDARAYAGDSLHFRQLMAAEPGLVHRGELAGLHRSLPEVKAVGRQVKAINRKLDPINASTKRHLLAFSADAAACDKAAGK